MFKNMYENDISVHGGVPKQFYHLKSKEFTEWEIAPWELIIDTDKLLGHGNWANVYLAEWRKTTVVAKVLKNNLDVHAKHLIIKEFNNMTKMHHPNIVQLFGYIEEPFVIVMEYFQNGDLYKNLNKLSLKQKIKITNDIIKGIIYIHERKPIGLIHRDLKLRNILLTNSYTAKIGDFGLSTFAIDNIIKTTSNNDLSNLECNRDNNEILDLTNNVGTERYMAPEIRTNNYNNKVDIYSCGILLLELFTTKLYIHDWITKYSKLNNHFIKLINEMISISPNTRPSAMVVLSRFNKINFLKTSILKSFIKLKLKGY